MVDESQSLTQRTQHNKHQFQTNNFVFTVRDRLWEPVVRSCKTGSTYISGRVVNGRIVRAASSVLIIDFRQFSSDDQHYIPEPAAGQHISNIHSGPVPVQNDIIILKYNCC